MGVNGVSPVDVARMFQPSTANVTRPLSDPKAETILKLFDNKPKSFIKLRSNYLGNGLDPQLKF